MKQEIIKCLEDPKVINFKDEWLASENQMESDILSAFCFYDIDQIPKDMFSSMSSGMLNKLKLLTLISMCETLTDITYENLKERCLVSSEEELENLLIKVQPFVDLRIDNVARSIRVITNMRTRDIYCQEKELPFPFPAKRSKAEILNSLKLWREKLKD